MKRYYIRVLIHVLSILAAAVTLCFLAFYNRYPLVFNNDSGVYIENGMYGIVAADRPILYGLFILALSFCNSLWGVVLAQGLITALVLYYYFRYFVGGASYLTWYYVFVLLISLVTSASFEVSWLMPDIFTPLCLLLMGLLMFSGNMKTRDLVIVSLLMIFSIGTHNSHMYICFCVCAVIMCGFLIPSIKRMYTEIGFRCKRLLYTVLLIIGGVAGTGGIHYLFTGQFESSRGGSVFFMSNLIEMGVVDIYLDENCATKEYRICAYKDSLPNNFLWNYEGPIGKLGGWTENEKEFGELVKDIVQKPRYAKMVLGQSVIYTLKQLCNYDIVDISPPGDRIKNAIELNYPLSETEGLENARENNNTLKTGFINFAQNIVVGWCLYCYTVMLWRRRYPSKYRLFILFILICLLVNAAICSIFSGVFPRYQTRVIWLLPLPLFMYAVESRWYRFRLSLKLIKQILLNPRKIWNSQF